MDSASVVQAEGRRSRLSQRVQSIPPSGIRRFFDLLGSIDGVISLGVGEPDFTTPWRIREAAIHSIEKGHTMYTSNYGLIELREELAHHLLNRYGVSYDPKTELLITVGVSEGMDLALRALLDPGDQVLIPEPSYVSYMPCAVLAGGEPVPVPTYPDDNFRLRAPVLQSHITERTKAMVIGYPSNPTGAVMTRSEYLEIAETVRRNDLMVVSDEIYDQLTYEGRHTSFASLPGMRERTVLLGGFSKAYAMTGWRIGYVAASAEIIEGMMKVHQYVAMCAPIMSQYAALEALRHGSESVREMVEDYDRRRRLIVKGFNEIGLTCFEPKGAFYAFPSIAVTGLTSDQFAEKLLQEEKVVVVPGSAFGEHGEGHVRACYATAVRDIEEALVRIERFVRRHTAQ
ncbi:MAG: aminotransferase class I/II-fold pyridoxal phosphate-dependent enzyme [Chloroflexi bacterium]|nr:aminotransferase class I/II-fold pyridoxal phosphate-dependent enzyme [Chloroflexota bacterium]